ncbi:hypothetical protein BO94DRAFT_611734, partial [Aspergillus sclerotioniger CBS 115572]
EEANKPYRALKEAVEVFKEHDGVIREGFCKFFGDSKFATSQVGNLNALHYSSLEWAELCPVLWSKQIRLCWTGLWQWSINHARREPQDLSQEQKASLIASLDGYCVQEDFDFIYSRLPERLQAHFLPNMVAIYLFKDCVEKFFTNPFWYTVPRPGMKKADLEKAGFGTQVYNIYKNILADNPRNAHLWRVWTTRFSHPSTELGTETVSHRISTANALCTEVWNKDLLQSLTRTLGGSAVSDGFSWLQRIYNDFATAAVTMSAHLSYVHFGTLEDPSPLFSRSSNDTEASGDHVTGENLDGHRILVLEHPAVYICGGWDNPNERRLQKKAVVQISERKESSSP